MKIPKILTASALALAALAVEGGLLQLARWQHHRYLQRVEEQAEFSARAGITVQGTWRPAATFALTNQPNPQEPDGEVGWRILTPLQTASGTLIVDRGFTPPSLNADGSPDFTPFQPQAVTATLHGILQPFPQRHGWLQGPDTTTDPHLLAFLNPSLITSETQPAYLLSRTPEAALTAVPPPLPSPLRHYSYMLQWLGLAIAFPILCLTTLLKKRKP